MSLRAVLAVGYFASAFSSARDAGLGPYPAVTLAMAREIAEKWRPLVASGIDPIERRKEQRVAERVEAAKAMTFDDCRTAYIAAHEASWRNPKHRQQWANTLRTYVTPVFGKLPVQAVDTLSVRLGILQVRHRWASAGTRAHDGSRNLLEIGRRQPEGGGIDPAVYLLG